MDTRTNLQAATEIRYTFRRLLFKQIGLNRFVTRFYAPNPPQSFPILSKNRSENAI